MAKPYISDKEAARIDEEAVAGGYKALRAPSKSSWLNRVLGKPTFLRSRADALREERERSKSRAESSLEAAADTINIVKQVEGARDLGRSARRVVNTLTDGLTGDQRATADDAVKLGAAAAGIKILRGTTQDRLAKDVSRKWFSAPSFMYTDVDQVGLPRPALYGYRAPKGSMGATVVLKPERVNPGPGRPVVVYESDAGTPLSADFQSGSPREIDGWGSRAIVPRRGSSPISKVSVEERVLEQSPFHRTLVSGDGVDTIDLSFAARGNPETSLVELYRDFRAGRDVNGYEWPSGVSFRDAMKQREAEFRMAREMLKAQGDLPLASNDAERYRVAVAGQEYLRQAIDSSGHTRRYWIDGRKGVDGIAYQPVPEEYMNSLAAGQVPYLEGKWYGAMPYEAVDRVILERPSFQSIDVLPTKEQLLQYDMTRRVLDKANIPFETYEAHEDVSPLLHEDAKGGDTRADAKGGDVPSSETAVSEMPVSEAPQDQGGPRIVINPTTFHNKKDAMCVAFNEGFRLWMEATGFEPQSEPTDDQRKFFSDTAYADDELQLRRTILARIATFDTSVKDPTDDQLSETASFLDAILESDWCKNDWERDAVSRLSNAVKAAVGAEPIEPREAPLEPKEQEPLQARAAMGGGETEDEERIPPPPATDEDLNGDGTAIDHQADVIAQAEAENESDREEANAEYAKLQASGALADNASFDNEAPETAQKLAQEPSAVQPGEDTGRAAAAQPAPGESPNPAQSASEEPLSPAKPRRRGAIENDIVSPDSPGSLSYKGTRKGGIENDIVSPDSPGSLSFRGIRRGGIENPIVNPESEGSIAFSGIRPGGIESPIVDPDSPGPLSYRRRKKRRR